MARNDGFTLLEILVALFIFTILSVILASALHNIIGTQDRTEQHAARLRKLQFALVLVSRDIEQTVDRPVLTAQANEEKAFLGTPREFSLTHAGLSNPDGAMIRSNLQRTRYYWDKDTLLRMVWPALDQAPDSKPTARAILTNVVAVHFRYLDKENHFHDNWPTEQSSGQALPRAVKIELTLSDWGSISQLYVIPAQPKK